MIHRVVDNYVKQMGPITDTSKPLEVLEGSNGNPMSGAKRDRNATM